MEVISLTKIRRYLTLSVFSFVFYFSYSSCTFAGGFQLFYGLNYQNPAQLTSKVKDTQFILGNGFGKPEVRFRGKVITPDPLQIDNGIFNVVDRGTTRNRSTIDLPFGRLAKRLGKQIVIGVELSGPFLAKVQYSNTSVSRHAVNYTKLSSVDIAPIIAYQFGGILSKLSIGAAIDFFHIYAKVKQQNPSLPVAAFRLPFGSGPDVTIVNEGSRWTNGWHVGAFYQLFKPTALEVSYFSPLTPQLKGARSTFTGFQSKSVRATIKLPATTNFAIKQAFSKTWFSMLQLHYTQWHRLNKIFLKNTAGPSSSAVFIFNYRNTWRVDLGVQHKINPKLMLGSILSFDQQATNNKDRVLNFPEVNRFLLNLMAEYNFNDNIATQFNYLHGFFVKKAPLHSRNPNTNTRTIGKAALSVNAIGLQVTVNV